MLMRSSLLYEHPTHMTFSTYQQPSPQDKVYRGNWRELPFVDTLIQRNSDNIISVRVYRKPTHTNQYLKFTFHHLARAKKSFITSLFDKAKHIISNSSDLEKEENHLTAVLQANSYPKKFINNKASKLPRQPANNDNTENQEQISPVRINLPHVWWHKWTTQKNLQWP